jgi:GTP-binding protein
MINFQNVTFVKSCPGIEDAPSGTLPEVLIVGKSNVGKSSLINAICGRKSLAFTSSKPGHTRLLNYFNIDNKFHLVDAPGYGYARGGVDLDALFGEMMSNYFAESKNLKLVLLLLDSRREFATNDLEILEYMEQENIPYFIVITKTDKINQKEKSHLLKHLKQMNVEIEKVYLTSSRETRTLVKLKGAIEKVL